MADAPENGAPEEAVVDATAVEEEPQAPAADQAAGEAAPSGAGGEAPGVPEDEPDYKDQWMRAVAELDNVRKRSRRDAAVAEQRGIARLAREQLPALDNLDRAIESAREQGAPDDFVNGLSLVRSELIAAFERVGIVAYSPQGEPFDPHVHEAIAQQPAEGVASGTVIEVYQSGYRLGDEILRAAKVVVSA
ncbi:MAG: nucleotide exchange factor GrpE [Solirubrobacteraceae bacterium]|nr:nucleotide exchange factor GrpE [Solirubrobacteraceae bacterium]